MAFRSKTYKGEGYNELLFEDAPGREQLNFHAQRDMNVVVLNDKSTTVNGNVTETINRQQVIDIGIDRFAEVQKNANIMVKQQNVNVGQSYQLLSNGNIHFDSKTSIILKTQGAYISISKDKILVQGDKMVTLNGENVLFENLYDNAPTLERPYIDDGEGIYADMSSLTAENDSKNFIDRNKRGKGKWVLKEIDYDGMKNTLLFTGQALSYYDEGKPGYMDVRAGLGMTRTVILQWKPLTGAELVIDDEIHDYGEEKIVKQKFIYGKDDFAIGGYSYYWEPGVGWHED